MSGKKTKNQLVKLATEALPAGYHSGLTLLPGGHLAEIDDDGEVKDLSERAASGLFSRILVHADFTVRDLFKLFERNKTSLEAVFERVHFSPWLNLFHEIESGKITALKKAPKAVKKSSTKTDAGQPVVAFFLAEKDGDLTTEVAFVELSWHLTACQGEESYDRDIRTMIEKGLAGEIKPANFKIKTADGESLDDLFSHLKLEREKEIREELQKNVYWQRIKAGYWLTGTDFPVCNILTRKPGGKRLSAGSMSFMPLHRLLSARMRLSTDFLIVRQNKDSGRRGRNTTYKNPSVTLGQFIQGFLWELSFFGSPAQMSETARRVGEKVKKIKRQLVKPTAPR